MIGRVGVIPSGSTGGTNVLVMMLGATFLSGVGEEHSRDLRGAGYIGPTPKSVPSPKSRHASTDKVPTEQPSSTNKDVMVCLFCVFLNAHGNLHVEVPVWSLRVASATSPTTTGDLFFRLEPANTGSPSGDLITYISLNPNPTTPRDAASWSAPDPLTPSSIEA